MDNDWYKRRAGRALGSHAVSEAVVKVRAIVGPNAIPVHETSAQAAWDKLRNGDDPAPEELLALEMVIRLLRPAPLSRAGKLDALPNQQGRDVYPEDLIEAWGAFRLKVDSLLYSIGRIECNGRHIGTGFIVAEGVVATNRHVVDEMTMGSGVLPRNLAQIVFQGEQGSTNRPEHTVTLDTVLGNHDVLDIALLGTKSLGRLIVPLDAATLKAEERVVAIGYPAEDERRNPLFTGAIFGKALGFKRAALGEVLPGTRTPYLFHDCSTLGGNSGSPVFSLATGSVVGIHRSGYFMYRNEAVDGPSLKPFAET
jgi:S1-C subfamily serine protease